MSSSSIRLFSDLTWLRENIFEALREVSRLLASNDNRGRDALIRLIEHRQEFPAFSDVISSLIQKAGLYPYLLTTEGLSTAELVDYEFHSVEGLDDIVLNSVQARVYRALSDGANVILSAPTSFGKSLLIDAVIASRRFKSVVVIVPTIALIDETRRRLAHRFGDEFKIVTHASQKNAEKNIFVLTQERFVEFEQSIVPDFFVVDEFYKLSPERDDERAFVLNQAFYQLRKSGAKFFLLGPNIQEIRVDPRELDFRYFQTDFTTVATEIEFAGGKKQRESALTICSRVTDPTLIFCKSAPSAYDLAGYLNANGVGEASREAKELAAWIRTNYHKDWILADLLDDGFGVHHGALPRSIAYHMLRLFNDGKIPFLLCTSTIIEGVNTSARHIIIYDNKIATTKFDQFTFNNIKGRAGRMFKHFVGHIHVLQDPPQQPLPFVDIPSITQPESAPESLLVQIDDSDLTASSAERLKYLHAQDALPMEIIKRNSGVQPSAQIDLAEHLLANLKTLHPLLSWTNYPSNPQLRTVCRLIFEYLMEGKGRDGAASAKQLHYKMSQLNRLKSIDKLVEDEMLNNNRIKNATEAVEAVLKFRRNWAEFNFPRYLRSLDRIQKSVFERKSMRPGNYDRYATEVQNLFLPLSATLLEEYGLPFQVTRRVEESVGLGEDVDTILQNLKSIDATSVGLTGVELEMFNDTVANL